MQRTLVMVFMGAIFFVPMTFGENSSKTIRVTASDFHFMPNAWTVESGQEVALSLINNGVQEHEWVLLKQGSEIVLPFDDDDEDKVFWEVEAGPGTTKEENFIAPSAPGVYSIVCGKPRHIERGMKATLVVR